MQKFQGRKSVEDRVQQYGGQVHTRLIPDFQRAGVVYPPHSVTLVGLKRERRLEVYAAGVDGKSHFIRAYPILAASGSSGPKLREGDYQVPEGIYSVASLNPNSLFHLALRVGYPNAFDRTQAEKERRADLGGDIMIHGGHASVGCLAMGDPAAEDLFVLTAETGPQNVTIVLCPLDFRAMTSVPVSQRAPWVDSLYATLQSRLRELPKPV